MILRLSMSSFIQTKNIDHIYQQENGAFVILFDSGEVVTLTKEHGELVASYLDSVSLMGLSHLSIGQEVEIMDNCPITEMRGIRGRIFGLHKTQGEEILIRVSVQTPGSITTYGVNPLHLKVVV